MFNKEEVDVVTGILEFEKNEGLSSILKEFKFDDVSWDYEVNKRNDAITALIMILDIFCFR